MRAKLPAKQVDSERAGPSAATAVRLRLVRARGRRGLSLLEMMVATAMMATLMASVVVVMRSSLAVWNAQEADIDVLENGYGVLRHFVQQLRQADAITVISIPSDTTGDLSFTTSTGVTRGWSHNGAPKQVMFDNGTSNQLLANKIDSMSFTGYKADGATQTTVVDDIQVVQCAVQITLPQGSRTLTTRSWIRSW
jgi:prepilin-type N-terminal cleavage/methylation domain-containing protein